MTPELQPWIQNHYPDYVSALRRVEKTRTLLLSGSPEKAGEILRKAYVFAVLSIRTGLERHEKGFTQWSSGMDIREAAKETVYPNQKANWMEETFRSVDWNQFGKAVQCHFEKGRHETVLDLVVDKLKGTSYRKGGFVLSMSGGYEFMCIDSHVADFAGLEDHTGNSLSFNSAGGYLNQCSKVVAKLPNPLNFPPFLLQWAIYDWQRSEHARHIAFYREVLPEILFEG